MIAVIEKTTESEYIIGFIENIQDLITYVDKQVVNLEIVCTKLQNISENELTSDTYIEGNYLVECQNTFSVYKKDVQINVGYIYNTTTYTITKIYSWYTLPVGNNVVYPNSSIANDAHITIDSIIPEIFDLSNMCKNPKILMVAKRGSGKSYAIRSLVKHFESLSSYTKDNLVVSPTDKICPFYKYFVGDSIIKYEVDNSLKDIQRITQRNSNGYLIMDNCFHYHKKNNNMSSTLGMLLPKTNKNAVIVTAQTPILISSSVAKDFDYIFVFNENTETSRRKIHAKYCNFMSYDNFNQIMNNLVSFQMIVINNTSLDIKDRVKLFIAEKFTCD